ncbi:hypothetical protein CCACVL1_08132 [Corchorus capsularis]|uniref:Uncharacterized protein n=1 Tax=Corchorus capsularis TaxID=210143 RepID=A0A1R3J289_COCAP|nr:hypothetical protein CCACVL1_08132 [Corchorus capsularis]
MEEDQGDSQAHKAQKVTKTMVKEVDIEATKQLSRK